VVFDEVDKANIFDKVFAMRTAKTAIVGGDVKQLGPMAVNKEARKQGYNRVGETRLLV